MNIQLSKFSEAAAPQTALAHVLRGLRIAGDGSSYDPAEIVSWPVTSVLRQVRERVGAEENPRERCRVLRAAEQLFGCGEAHWLFPEGGADWTDAYRDLVTSLMRHAELPACETDSGTLPAPSYADVPGRARPVLGAVLVLTERLSAAAQDVRVRRLALALAPCLSLFAITHLLDQPWTDLGSRNAATELLDSVVMATGSLSVQEMLCGGKDKEQGILGQVLRELQPEMTKERWKRNEAVKHVFSWLLCHVTRPHLADHLTQVIPPALLISDDYRTDHQVLGVHCLQHIICHAPAADLRQYNRAEVLYHALYHHLYTHEAQLIQVVLPCLIDLLAVLEKPSTQIGLPRKPNRYDEVLRLILTHMEMEQKVALRRVYAANLTPILQTMGILAVRCLRRLERVIVGYLEVPDPPGEEARLSMLSTLEVLLQTAWPRMESRVCVLAGSLLRCMCDMSSECIGAELEAELSSKASRCLLMLDHCCHGNLRARLAEVEPGCCSAHMFNYIQRVTKGQDL